MNVLWIFAHPEQRSLNAALRDEGLRTLDALGHRTRLSDLYAMGWNPLVGPADYRPHAADGSRPDHSGDARGAESGDARGDESGGARLVVTRESKRAYTDGTLSEDIRAEQDKLRWADTIVLQFPMWWFGVPAILKGWFDRVFVKGFAYGVKDADGRTLRYGEGGLAGKRALVVMTVGSPEPGFGPRGIHGEMAEVLWPLLHGTLWYSGISALPPLALHGADRMSDAAYRAAAKELRGRLERLGETAPIPYRRENGGDYDRELMLHPQVAPGRTGIGVHRSA